MNNTPQFNSPQFTAPQRFEATSSREALRLAREQLGPDAMVMSSQVTATGVAIVAVAEVLAPAYPIALMPAHVVHSNPVGSDTVLREIHAMRGMIEEQLASLVRHDAERLSWSAQITQAMPSLKPADAAAAQADPLRSQLLRIMLGAGLSPRLARSTLAAWPSASHAGSNSLASAITWLKATLASQLPVLGNEDALMDEGGVYALVGPTGVGKTTTTAKLAARCVMRFGAEHLALVTTDTFRIGAVEQLRIYGEILGVPVYAVQGADELDGLLTQLRGKHMVLIDTVGMSQRDRAVADQLALLSAPKRQVKRLLLLNAASQGDTLDEVVRAYQNVGGAAGQPGQALAGCIFTKVDEAVHSGALIDIAIREQLRVHYVANGQQVPENLLLARAESLVDSVLAVRAPSAWIDTESSLPAPPLKSVEAITATASATASTQGAQQLLRALAHDRQVLRRAAAQLESAPLGYAATRALWQGQAAEPGLAPEVQAAGWLLAITGKSVNDSRAAYSTLMLSAQDGTPVLAPTACGWDAPDGIQGFENSHEALTNLHGLPVVHVLARPPRCEQIEAWAQTGLRWVAQGSAAVRVKAPQIGHQPTLAHVLKAASFGPALATTFRRKPALQSLIEMEIELLDDDAAAGAKGSRVRCVIKRITDTKGKALNHSFVLCPIDLPVLPAQLVQWPVWRTEAEPYFKLLTQALTQPLAETEQDVQSAAHWQLAAQACITVYRLQRLEAVGECEGHKEADATRKLLARLAGRAVRPSQPITGPTLLDGLAKLMALLDACADTQADAHHRAQFA